MLSVFLAPYAVSLRADFAIAYALTVSASRTLSAPFSILDHNPVSATHRAAWAAPSANLQSATGLSEIIVAGAPVRIVEGSISCDENSPVWLAEFGIAELSAFASIRIGDSVECNLGGELFRFVVDGKNLSRGSPGGIEGTITAVSRLALFDAPFSRDSDFVVAPGESARAFVERILGPVAVWNFPDWSIPAGMGDFTGTTPAAASRRLVAAAGGRLESAANGDFIVRPLFPIDVADYATAAVAHTFDDGGIVAIDERISPTIGFSRVTISNEDASGIDGSGSDSLEFEASASDSHSGIIYGYPGPWRDVSLVHTGDPDTTIVPQGQILRSVSEVVEFREGRAMPRDTIENLIAFDWVEADLGAVAIVGRELVSGVPGYSLAAIEYQSKAYAWGVSNPHSVEVQFVMMG